MTFTSNDSKIIDELTGRILASFRKSRNEISGWLEKADSAFFTQRNRVLEG